jgi:transketolase
MLDNTKDDHAMMANCIRALAMDAVEAANSGHPGAPMGMADIAAVLYARHLRFDAAVPDWPDRDRVILSNGHASAMLYSLLYLTGTPGMTLDEIKAFRQWGSKTAGHPEYGHAPGIETTTGPLGQGLGNSVGFALAEWRLREEFGADLCDHRTWVFCGDGCLMEGIGQEAVSLAGHLGLGRINLLYDDNGISIDGSTQLSFSDDTAAKFAAMGWHVQKADGHDHEDIDAALIAAAAETSRPSIILFKTTIGFGSPNRAGSEKVHGAALGAAELAATKAGLGLPAEPFALPDGGLDSWRAAGRRGAADRTAWQARLDVADPNLRSEFDRRMRGDLPAEFESAFETARAALIAAPKKVATRKASEMALDVFTAAVPELIGGSADLTHSNLTITKATEKRFTRSGTGRYVSYGVREFAMGAALNGMALHGGVIAYGGTFLVFSDYMRNAIRLAAMNHKRVIFVMTHDSIGLGEDGPTHQPVEHMASLRAIPGLQVLRPADVVETLEAWHVALTSRNAASLLALSRQGVPQLRLDTVNENLTARGGYVLRDAGGPRDVTLIGTGTELHMAAEAAEELAAKGLNAAVVSLPSWDLFEAQPPGYRASVLGTAPRVAIEAASPFGWTRYVASEADFIGVRGYGASAPAERIYQEFGITKDAVIKRALELIQG